LWYLQKGSPRYCWQNQICYWKKKLKRESLVYHNKSLLHRYFGLYFHQCSIRQASFMICWFNRCHRRLAIITEFLLTFYKSNSQLQVFWSHCRALYLNPYHTELYNSDEGSGSKVENRKFHDVWKFGVFVAHLWFQ
jgi:hypothetical protein